MKTNKLNFKPYGERSILIEWPQEIEESILADILVFKKRLIEKYAKQNVYINSAYNSILITYDYIIENIYNEISIIKKYKSTSKSHVKTTQKLWRIPVCYDPIFGLDLDEIASHKELSIEEIISLHSQKVYTVYFIGFLPGFLYLGGLDEKLFIPRKANPRLQIDKGAVAIGGKQTGIYPNASPGGWNIIGNSPINLFDSKMDPPCFASSGDKIQFAPVSRAEYSDIKSKCSKSLYQLEKEVIYG